MDVEQREQTSLLILTEEIHLVHLSVFGVLSSICLNLSGPSSRLPYVSFSSVPSVIFFGKLSSTCLHSINPCCQRLCFSFIFVCQFCSSFDVLSFIFLCISAVDDYKCHFLLFLLLYFLVHTRPYISVSLAPGVDDYEFRSLLIVSSVIFSRALSYMYLRLSLPWC